MGALSSLPLYLTLFAFAWYAFKSASYFLFLFHPNLLIPDSDITAKQLWSIESTKLDVYVFLADGKDFVASGGSSQQFSGQLVYSAINTHINNISSSQVSFALPNLDIKSFQSWYLHALICHTDYPCPSINVAKALNLSTVEAAISKRNSKKKRSMSPDFFLYSYFELTSMMPKRAAKRNGTLLDGDVSDAGKEEPTIDTEELVPYWKPRLSIQFVHSHSGFQLRDQQTGATTVPADLIPHLRWAQFTKPPSNNIEALFLPIMFMNDLSTRTDEYIPIDSNSPQQQQQPSFQLYFSTISLGAFRLNLHFYNAIHLLHSHQLMKIPEKELDDLREMFFKTSPVLLLTTLFVAVVHTLLELLAVQSDIAFWKNQKNVQGISSLSMVLETCCKIIIFAYLYDKNDETSMIVWGLAGMTALLEVWKLGLFFRRRRQIVLANKGTKETKTTLNITNEVDRFALRYVTLPFIPVIIGYAVYNLYTYAYTSWTSWLLDSLSTLAYALEFVLLTPQLIINYRLKSVESMNWKVFFYRSLNTIIDDLFAIVIPQPLIARIGSFRDDVVFVVLMYQMWKYPKRKANGEEDEDKKKKTE